jgi:hypothetical protein
MCVADAHIGYKHSWSHVFASKGDIWIGMLDRRLSDFLPSPNPPKLDKYDEATQTWSHEGNELQFIELKDKDQQIVRVGAATTNEQFRQWAERTCYATLPLNVIMVEITFGGSNAPMCHGAGHQHKTLSDLVVEIEIVIADGSIRKFKGPELGALAGALGLAGVVLSITFKLEPMTYANMTPTKEYPSVAVPPPFELSPNFASSTAGAQRATFDHDLAVFKQRIGDTYYSEFFWFTFHQKNWVNCWRNDGRKEDAEKTFPSPAMVVIEKAQETLLNVANSTVFKALPEIARAKVFAATAMMGLPDGKHEVAHVINALHFRRGIHNARVRDIEAEIPIGADEHGNPDDKVCRLAWWAAINLIEKWRDEKKKAPVRCALEMRIMGGSDVLLAPEGGNRFTCSIEVLTFINQPDKEEQEWFEFTQELLDVWHALVPQANIRLHWAKEWERYSIRGKPIKQYVVENAYKDQIPKFREILEKNSPHCQQRFSNELFDEIIFAKRFVAVRIEKAQKLRKADVFGKSDPYTIVRFHNEEKRTRVINKTLDPAWDQEFSFSLDHVDADAAFTFTVMDKDKIGKDDFLGQAVIPLKDLQAANGSSLTVQLKKQNSDKNAKGTLTISWRYT